MNGLGKPVIWCFTCLVGLALFDRATSRGEIGFLITAGLVAYAWHDIAKRLDSLRERIDRAEKSRDVSNGH